MRRGGDVLVLLDGELRGAAAVRARARAVDAVVCADGGARHARRLGLVPDAVVGDLDSVPRARPRGWARTEYVRVPDPERGDLDKALDHAESLGARRAWVAAALGGLMDHELVNLAVLESRRTRLELVLLGEGEARLLGPGRHVLDVRRKGRFSLLAAPRARVTLRGARYPLRDAVLLRDSRGLGNTASGPVTLAVAEGRVWVIVPRPA